MLAKHIFGMSLHLQMKFEHGWIQNSKFHPSYNSYALVGRYKNINNKYHGNYAVIKDMNFILLTCYLLK